MCETLIEIKGNIFLIEFNYSKGEKETLFHPGESEEIEITNIFHLPNWQIENGDFRQFSYASQKEFLEAHGEKIEEEIMKRKEK